MWGIRYDHICVSFVLHEMRYKFQSFVWLIFAYVNCASTQYYKIFFCLLLNFLLGRVCNYVAAGNVNEVISVQTSEGNLSDKKELIVCNFCEEMKMGLHDVKLVLCSFRKIIRVLQEEIREISPSTQPTENKGNEFHEDEEPQPVSTSGEWTTLLSQRRRNTQHTRRNLRQLPIVTSNQFATVGNLKNENESSENVPL